MSVEIKILFLFYFLNKASDTNFFFQLEGNTRLCVFFLGTPFHTRGLFIKFQSLTVIVQSDMIFQLPIIGFKGLYNFI